MYHCNFEHFWIEIFQNHYTQIISERVSELRKFIFRLKLKIWNLSEFECSRTSICEIVKKRAHILSFISFLSQSLNFPES